MDNQPQQVVNLVVVLRVEVPLGLDACFAKDTGEALEPMCGRRGCAGAWARYSAFEPCGDIGGRGLDPRQEGRMRRSLVVRMWEHASHAYEDLACRYFAS